MTVTPIDRGQPAARLPESTWRAAVQALSGASEITLACHVNPDGDALGSMLALALALDGLGKRVAASWSGAPIVPPTYASLPGRALTREPAALPRAPELFVTLDTSSRERLGELEALVDAAGTVLVIDHHARGDGFGTIRLVDPAAAATAVVVEELVARLGAPLTRDVAACLYTGLTTDTGSFKYPATTPAVHELAARLLATGIRHDLISREIWDTNPLGYLRLLGEALCRMRSEPDAVGGLGLVWTVTTADDLRRYALTLPEIEGIIDVIRTADVAEVAVIVKSDRDGSRQVSMRTKGRLDVGAVCAQLGGGGHRFAAGFTSYDDVDTTMRQVRAALADAPHLPA